MWEQGKIALDLQPQYQFFQPEEASGRTSRNGPQESVTVLIGIPLHGGKIHNDTGMLGT
jgi:hypothetical protein